MRKSMVFEGVVAILFILLCFTMYVMVAGNITVKTNDWDIATNGPYQNLQIGEDGTLYTFIGDTGNTIYAIDPSGNTKWNLQVPEQWKVANTFNKPTISQDDGDWRSWTTDIMPVFSAYNGTMYIYLRENRSTFWSHYPSDNDVFSPSSNAPPLQENLLAISQSGDILWNKPIGTDYYICSDVAIKAANGRVYVFDNYNLTVLDAKGSTLFEISNVSDSPAIDEEGRIYVVSSAMPSWISDIYPTNGYMMPSDTLRAYNADGTLWWQEHISMPAWRQDDGILPIYQNNTLYLPVHSGMIALYTNGSAKWQKIYDWSIDSSLLAPIDSNGNVYLQYSRFHGTPSIEVINSDGKDVVNRSLHDDKWSGYTGLEEYLYNTGTKYDGYLYYANVTLNGLNRTTFFDDAGYGGIGSSALDGLATNNATLWQALDVRLNAVNMPEDTKLWSSRIPLQEAKTVTITKDNVAKYLPSGLAPQAMDEASWDLINNSTQASQPDPASIGLSMNAKVLPGQNIIYVSLWASYIDDPIIYSKSGCTYSSAIYAFSKNGTLLWEKPTDYYVASMAANNSTVFFNTADGRFNMATINGAVAGGVTILALVYLFFRFFMVGFVARAKDRVNKNENRNVALQYVVDNPGSTLREISRGTGINLGTVRYHVFILGMNHRIASSMADNKHVRYFTNGGSYSKEEQFVISLMRRDGMKKILELLNEKPGLTNLELSSALGLQESAISRYMKELSEKGIVVRDTMSEGRLAYTIKNDYRKAVSTASGLSRQS